MVQGRASYHYRYVGNSSYAQRESYLSLLLIPHCAAALLGVKAYVEIFEGRMRKTTVNYKNFRQSTHAAIGLFVLSSLAFHIALWPHYHWNTILVLGIAFFGVILQLLLLLPSWLQNIVSFVAVTLFLQEYS